MSQSIFLALKKLQVCAGKINVHIPNREYFQWSTSQFVDYEHVQGVLETECVRCDINLSQFQSGKKLSTTWILLIGMHIF